MPDLLKFINELTVNGKPVEEDELEDDYTSTEDDENEESEDSNLDLSVGDNDQNDDTSTQDEEEPEDDDDYTTDPPDEDNTDGEEQPTDDNLGNEDDTDSSEGEDDLENKIRQTESEIFNSLSAEEKAIKNTELIDDFIAMKNVVKIFLEKVRMITLTESNTRILQFVEVSLIDLGNMINDYLIERYSKKTYIENFITYQHMVLTIRQLKEIISKVDIDENPKK